MNKMYTNDVDGAVECRESPYVLLRKITEKIVNKIVHIAVDIMS